MKFYVNFMSFDTHSASVLALPVPIPSFHNQGSSQPQFALPWNSEFPTLEYPPSSHAYDENRYSPDVFQSADPRAGPPQSPGYLVEANFRSRPTADGNNAFPWNRPSDAPSTSINGGTFIGGNVNNIQRHGEAGGSQ
jgi:hypothetical protein